LFVIGQFPRTLSRNPIEHIKKLTQSAKEMLEIWKSSYMETRQKIEDSGKGQRWEFDKKKLFSESDYMATVCKDLYDVATIIEEFNNIFGPELRAMVVDPQKIDNVAKRVERLVIQIESADFDIFSENHKENWEAIMAFFYKEVRKLEQEGVRFIDQSFKTLRSSESALEMLSKLKNVQTRQIILDRLLTKFDVILDQFNKELLVIDDSFTVCTCLVSLLFLI
jgi:dynein heavy chain